MTRGPTVARRGAVVVASIALVGLALLAVGRVSAAQEGAAATLVLGLESQVSCATRTVTHTVVGVLSISQEGATAEVVESQYEVGGLLTPFVVSPTVLSADYPETRSGPVTVALGVEVTFSVDYVVTAVGASTGFGSVVRASPADPDLVCRSAPTSSPPSGPTPTTVGPLPPPAGPAVAVEGVARFTG